MPGITRRRQTLEDDEDVSSDDHSGRGTTATSANKRARLDPDADPDHSGALDPFSATPSRTDARATRTLASSRRNQASGIGSKHQPGSIIRVAVENFVTYTAATFDMGPALNMIIGPNGTGKSTLVCAICLGLGWGTQHLGRAKELSEFVKHGCSEANIEIELKGEPGKINPIIRRNIKREGNKSSWNVNGQSSTLKNVLSIAKGFSIQIDNLCQFLPQDRVVEFAQLSPIDLLASTQKAAAPPQMSEWHEELKTLRGEQKKVEADRAHLIHNLTNFENRQNLLRGDVEKMRERVEIQEKVDMLEKIRPMARYTVAKERFKEASALAAIGTKQLAALNKELAPETKAMDDKKAYVDLIDEVLKQKTNLAGRFREQEKLVDQDFEKSDKDLVELRRERQVETKRTQERKKEMDRSERMIATYEERMREEPIEVDLAGFNEKIRDKTRQVRELEDEISERQQAKKDRLQEIGSRSQRVQHAENQLENLRSKSGQQDNKLSALSRDTAKAWKWIQEHKHEFKAEIYGPPVVTCTVQDKRYVDAIESLFQSNEFAAITCTNRDDFQKLSDQLYKNQNLSDITLRNVVKPLSDYTPPVSDAEKESLGLEGWALEYLSGPDPVLSMLCGEKRLNQTGVVLRDITDQQYSLLERSRVSSWVTSKASYQITRRPEYGAGAASTRVRDINAAKQWTTQPVDTGAERELRETIDTCNSEMDELKSQQAQAESGISKLKSQIADLKKEKVFDDHARLEDGFFDPEQASLEHEKSDQQKALSAYQSLPLKIEKEQTKLNNERTLEKGARKRLQDIAKKETELIFKRGQLTVNYQRRVNDSQECLSSFIAASVAQIEAQSDLKAFALRSAAILAQLEVKKSEVAALGERKQKLREEAAALVQLVQSQPPEITEFWTNLPEEQRMRTPEELDHEIESLMARLDFLQGSGNEGVIREYEKRANDIERLKQKLAEIDERLTTLEKSITTIRDQWEPALDTLIAQISTAFAYSFEQINCAGAVSVYKGVPDGSTQDFEAWAIQVQVRFREGENMSILDSHRQSGGERAVSTIFYLMALQTLSRAPFRVVDEINQGMDPRNERMVHERMVDIACGTGEGDAQTSQYFLITPKLLTGLKYSPGMKVHCIASGEFMPKDGKDLDFRALLDRAKRMRALPVSAAA